METTQKNSIAPYVTAGLILLAGIVCFGVFLFHQLSSLDDNLVRFTIPGDKEVSLKEPGQYLIYHEYRSVVDGRVYSGSEGLSGLDVSLSSKKTGEAIPLSVPSATSRYDSGGASGVSLLEFHIQEPGAYRVRAGYAPGQTGAPAVLSINKDFAMKLVLAVFAAIGILFGSIIVSVVIVVWTLIKRNNAAKAAQPA